MSKGDRATGDEPASWCIGNYTGWQTVRCREQRGHALQTTALVNEAFIRLAGPVDSIQIQNQGHFFAPAARQIRRVAVDHAGSSQAERLGRVVAPIDPDRVFRGGGEKITDVLLLNESWMELASMDPRAANVIELRYFGRYTDKEVAEALGTSLATVRRDWEFARPCVFDYMAKNGK